MTVDLEVLNDGIGDTGRSSGAEQGKRGEARALVVLCKPEISL